VTASRRAAGGIFLASFLVLFQELALIRWVGAQVRVTAYFPNLILMAAFLGGGLGCLRAGRRSLAAWWAPSLLVLAGAVLVLGRIVFTAEGAGEHLWLLYYDLPRSAPVVSGVSFPLLLIFFLTAATFVPPGQFVGERLGFFESVGRPLTGYAWDLAGSLAGVALFSSMSWAGTFPVVWMSVVAAAGWTIFGRGSRGRRWALPAALLLLVAGVRWGERADLYSSYYALSLRPEGPSRVGVLANGSLHQVAVDMDDPHPPNGFIREGYDIPYSLLGRRPRKVLVVGAGTGNDVAVALRQGAESVDAVEIDPAIVRIGARNHPNAPYADPRVRVFTTDARSFLNGSRDAYDLIVFGTLDSMTCLSALSSVRLDNFMYTREAFLSARRRLTPDGGLVLYFMIGKAYIGSRIFSLLTEVFRQRPLFEASRRGLFNAVFAGGPAFDAQDGERRRALAVSAPLSPVAPTDDWPFLYLEKRGVSGFYLTLMGVLFLAAWVAVVTAAGGWKNGGKGFRADWTLFFFGAGFLLLETRAVTVMGLAWGNTWATNAVVFFSILLLTLGGVLVRRCLSVPWGWGTAGVLLCLGAVWAAPESFLAARGLGLKAVLSAMYVGGPVFFASLAFSGLYASRGDVSAAFGWNLIGAMAGGLSEFFSMAVGFKALVLLSMVFYLSASLAEIGASRRRGRPFHG